MCIHAVAADAADTAMMVDAAMMAGSSSSLQAVKMQVEHSTAALTDADAAVTKQRADAVVTRAATADATKEKNADATDS